MFEEELRKEEYHYIPQQEFDIRDEFIKQDQPINHQYYQTSTLSEPSGLSSIFNEQQETFLEELNQEYEFNKKNEPVDLPIGSFFCQVSIDKPMIAKAGQKLLIKYGQSIFNGYFTVNPNVLLQLPDQGQFMRLAKNMQNLIYQLSESRGPIEFKIFLYDNVIPSMRSANVRVEVYLKKEHLHEPIVDTYKIEQLQQEKLYIFKQNFSLLRDLFENYIDPLIIQDALADYSMRSVLDLQRKSHNNNFHALSSTRRGIVQRMNDWEESEDTSDSEQFEEEKGEQNETKSEQNIDKEQQEQHKQDERFNIFATLKNFEIVSDQDCLLQKVQIPKVNKILHSIQPSLLQTKLMPHQLEGLTFMQMREGSTQSNTVCLGKLLQEQSRTLHVAWKHLQNREDGTDFYFCSQTGQITLQKPVMSFACSGGILADQMGLGKTIMSLALILSDPGQQYTLRNSVSEKCELENEWEFDNPFLPSEVTRTAGTLIVTRASLLQQWQQEIEKHVRPGCVVINGLAKGREQVGVCVYYGQARENRSENLRAQLSKYDIVITTYQMVLQEYNNFRDDSGCNNLAESDQQVTIISKNKNCAQDSLRKKRKIVSQKSENQQQNFFQIEWHRIVLDEAHTIGNVSSKTSQACIALKGAKRWCLTGTPLQNRLEEFYALLKFIRIAPWDDWKAFRYYILRAQSPKEAFEVLYHIARPIYLRRTLDSKTSSGKSILENPLPSISVHELLLDLKPESRALYDMITNQETKKIDNMIACGKVPYMQILEALMRARQLCDHPSLLACKNKVAPVTERFTAHLKSLAQKQLMNSATDIQNHQQQQGQSLQNSQNLQNIQEEQEDQEDETVLAATSSQNSAKSTRIANYIEQLQEKVLNNELDQCVICFSPVEDIAITHCEQPHVFCRECLHRHIAEEKRRGKRFFACPSCRTKLPFADGVTFFMEESFTINENQMQGISEKVEAVVSKVDEILAQDTNNRIVVFSQFIRMNTLLLQHIGAKRCLQLSGDMKPSERAKVLADFQTKTNKPELSQKRVLIATLKVGGLGLNLTAAQHVILVDPWWNPALEDQAVQRVHRLGQTREVHVWRFLMRNTVEERIVRVYHSKKRTLAYEALASIGESAGNSRNSVSATKLNINQLKNLILTSAAN